MPLRAALASPPIRPPFTLLGRVSAIDDVVAAGDERRIVRGEEADECRDLLSSAETLHRVWRSYGLSARGVQNVEQRCRDEARSDAGDPDALGRVVERSGLREIDGRGERSSATVR